MAMRSIEKVRLPIIATLVSLSINAVLNWLLIFGIGPFPALGVVGAAIATVISRVVEMFILVIVAYRRSYAFAGRIRELLGFDAAFVSRYFRIASPVMVNELIWALGISMQNVIMARTDTNAIAAFNILNTVSQLTWVLFMGLGNGAAVLVGKKIGEGADDEARAYASRIVRFMPLVAAGVGLLLVPISWILPFIFNVGSEVFSILGAMIVIMVLSYPFRAFNMSMVIGVCRAGGDTVFCAVYDTAVMWAVALPAAAAASFIFHAPVWVVFLCIAMEDPLKMVLGLWRLETGKWLHDVTRK
jgi:putative MATE family efflux protein